jgi:Rrf2 family protein
MTQLFSRSSEYAIQAMIYISSKGEGTTTLVKEISLALGIPHHYLGKVLQQLAKSEILSSHRGTTGGFALARPAGSITLQDIISSVEGLHALDRCLLGLAACSSEQPCPIHERWSAVRTTVLSLLNESTVEALSKECEYAISTDQRLRNIDRHA